MKTKIFNLIILDESGSMDCMWDQTLSGCNETIDTIKASQEKFQDVQEHYVSIFSFQSHIHKASRYLIKNAPASEVKHITKKDYEPNGATPLYDALGSTLVDLKKKVDKEDLAIGSVTIITDGYENCSEHYTLLQVADMIDALKELGWNFNFIGANIDVRYVSKQLHIDNYLNFEQDEEAVDVMFKKERRSRMGYYERLKQNCDLFDAFEDIHAGFSCKEQMVNCCKSASANYFDEDTVPRITPEQIKELKRNEIFVFGSNPEGQHKGGASLYALKHFGAQMGQGEGLQGQSYAIPTTQGNVEAIRPYVDDFLRFATMHDGMTFLVTRIGCGTSGYKDEDIAPLFMKAVNIPNIYLPKSFWDILVQSKNL